MSREKYCRIYTIKFSPNFALDGTVFAGGGAGLDISTDRARSFGKLWSADGQAVVQISFSPSFAKDGTLAALVLFNSNVKINYLYLSENRGRTWVKLHAHLEPWVGIACTAGAGSTEGATVVALRNDGVLFVNNDLQNMQLGELQGARFADRPLGYGRDGITVAQNGELMASFREGGVVFGRVKKHLGELVDVRRPYHPNSLDHGQWAFTGNHAISNVNSKAFDDLVALSPNYHEDGIIFGASFYSVYASFDHGAKFQEIFTIRHRLPKRPSNSSQQLVEKKKNISNSWEDFPDKYN